MSYQVKTCDPLTGRKLWAVTDCKPCEGRGRVWYPGCGDSAATCSACDGAGEIAKSRDLDVDGNAIGPWRSE